MQLARPSQPHSAPGVKPRFWRLSAPYLYALQSLWRQGFSTPLDPPCDATGSWLEEALVSWLLLATNLYCV